MSDDEKDNSGITHQIIDTFICPVCNTKVEVARSEQGESILHPLPACETFIRLTADDYVKLVKKYKTGQSS